MILCACTLGLAPAIGFEGCIRPAITATEHISELRQRGETVDGSVYRYWVEKNIPVGEGYVPVEIPKFVVSYTPHDDCERAATLTAMLTDLRMLSRLFADGRPVWREAVPLVELRGERIAAEIVYHPDAPDIVAVVAARRDDIPFLFWVVRAIGAVGLMTNVAFALAWFWPACHSFLCVLAAIPMRAVYRRRRWKVTEHVRGAALQWGLAILALDIVILLAMVPIVHS